MKILRPLLSLMSLTLLSGALSASHLPTGFVYVEDLVPTIAIDLRYHGNDNFVGSRIDGYSGPHAILTEEAARAIGRVQADLASRSLGIKIFDAYRPKRGVHHFLRWSKDPRDTKTRAAYYPDLHKGDLFRLGYIARRSSHTRGSTVDITLVDLRTGAELDMGSPFDFFGPVSWTDWSRLTPTQKANRRMLREAMMKQGFKPYRMEWWHFTLRKEPFPQTYFDFEVR